jgi:hypothetical protein
MLLIFVCWFCILLHCKRVYQIYEFFGGLFRVFLCIESYHLQVVIIWLLFLFESLLFLSFVLLLWLGFYFLILNKSRESGHPCLIHCLISLFNVVFTIGLLYIAFIMLRYVLSIPISSKLLSWKRFEFCWSLFLLQEMKREMRRSCGFYLWFCLCAVFHLLICICWTIMAQNWNKTNLIIVYDLYSMLISVWGYFIENFYIYEHK